MEIKHFFDNKTFTLTYIVYDKETKDAVIIDPVLDLDYPSGTIQEIQVNRYKEFVSDHKLNLIYSFETHAHADHISSSERLKKHYPTLQTVINSNIKTVQKTFANILNLSDLKCDGSDFDLLIDDGDIIDAGSISIEVISTPGHTPACTSFLIGDSLFTGDSLFMPDFGTGRCDFPEGSAKDLFNSISNKIYKLNEETMVFVGHDYMPNGRELKFSTSIKNQKEKNKHLTSKTTLEEFLEFRNSRDNQLSAPTLLLPSIQINIRAGKLPIAESNGTSFLKIPIS